MRQKIYGTFITVIALALTGVIGWNVFESTGIGMPDYKNTIDASLFTEEELLSLMDTDDAVLCYTPDEDAYVELEAGCSYINNMVMVYTLPSAARKDKQELIRSIDGTLAGLDNLSNCLQIKIEAQSREELEALCASLLLEPSVTAAYYDIAMPLEGEYVPNDPYQMIGSCDWNGSFEQNNWAWEAIDAPKAWDYSEDFSDITVGVIDNGFWGDHEEFEDLDYTLYNAPEDKKNSHGTSVSSIIAAKADNGKGLAGMVQNISRLRFCTLYPDNINDSSEGTLRSQILVGLSRVQCCVSKLLSEVSGTGFFGTEEASAKVINLSQGYTGTMGQLTDELIEMTGIRLSNYLMNVLYNGQKRDPAFDFLIVQSAGNGLNNKMETPQRAELTGLFAAVTESSCQKPANTFSRYTKADILERIIVVSSFTHEGGTLTSDPGASYGETVDILAPGRDIYVADFTSFIGKTGGYSLQKGTSFSAPFVTGTAALIWSVNPELTGPQVKAILKMSSCQTLNAPDYNGMFRDENGSLYSYPVLNAGNAVELAVHTADVDLKPVCSVRITDESTGEPIEGAEVSLLTEDKMLFLGLPKPLSTDADGNCLFEDLNQEGSIGIIVNADGYEEYRGWVQAVNTYEYSLSAPYYTANTDYFILPVNEISLIPSADAAPENPEDARLSLDGMLASLVKQYGVIDTGTFDFESSSSLMEQVVPPEHLTGLLCADICDYDGDGQEELLTLRLDGSGYETGASNHFTRIAAYLSIYEEDPVWFSDNEIKPASELCFSVPALPDSQCHASFQLFRSDRETPVIYLDYFMNMVPQSFGLAAFQYDGKELTVTGGTECSEWPDHAGSIHCDLLEDSSGLKTLCGHLTESSTERNGWKEGAWYDWSGIEDVVAAEDAEEYMDTYQTELSSCGLSDTAPRSYLFLSGKFRVMGLTSLCTERPSEHFSTTDGGLVELCGILSPYADGKITFTCYDDTGNLSAYR